MSVKFWKANIKFWFFLIYVINAVKWVNWICGGKKIKDTSIVVTKIMELNGLMIGLISNIIYLGCWTWKNQSRFFSIYVQHPKLSTYFSVIWKFRLKTKKMSVVHRCFFPCLASKKIDVRNCAITEWTLKMRNAVIR